MPRCGSQIILCDLPIRFDTYVGCSHGCTYCFARKKQDINAIKPNESVATLERFINGKRSKETEWCDWNIPLHWGGMSDPFQPLEAHYKRSYDCLKVFAKTGYPFAFSTKGKIIATPEYLSVLKDCNAVSQVSMVSPRYDKLEPGAPTFDERMRFLPKLAENTKRLIIRISPYAVGLADEVCGHLQDYKDAGVFGIEVEAMKRTSKKPGLVKVGGDWCYPVEVLRKEFSQIREKAKEVGLAFYSGENRLRAMGDDSCCCGVTGVPGFKPNRANLNRLVFGKEIEYTSHMKQPGTGGTFSTLIQKTLGARYVREESYETVMDISSRSKTHLIAMGLLAEDTE